MSTATLAPIYECLKGEPAKAYAAFCVYRDMGPGRSFEQAGRVVHGARTGRKRGATGRLREWAATYSWAARAQAWDERQDAIRREEAERVAREEAADLERRKANLKRRELELSEMLLDQAETMLRMSLVTQRFTDGRPTLLPARWSKRDAALYIATASKIGRLALGLETDRMKGELTGKDEGPLMGEAALAGLTEAELRALVRFAEGEQCRREGAGG